MTGRLVMGEERRRRLLAFGFSEALVDAVSAPEADPVSARVWAAGGEALAEIVELPWVREMLPPGRVVPVCSLDDSSVHFALLVLDEGDAGTLLSWQEEFCEPIEGGVAGFLVDALRSVWESERFGHAQLLAWAEHVGVPEPEAVLRDFAKVRS